MIDLYARLRPVLFALDPERAHRMTLAVLKAGLGPACDIADPCLKVSLWGREFRNPLGLAAGFDKEAEAIAPLMAMGFGFIEAGTVTPLPQPGNPRPRLFRDAPSRSVVNRLGFPGAGLDAFAVRVAAFRAKHPAPPGLLGVNIGINKDTASPFEDYRQGIATLAGVADYIAVNVSSPNTPGLRDLQRETALAALLAGLVAARDSCDVPAVAKPPLLVKVAPDLTAAQKEAIAELALRHRLDGLIVANTTTDRPDGLSESLRAEAGGLSGQLLREKALETLRDFYRLTRGALPLVGVGGIASAEDAWARICAGASLVQVYTGLVYEGPRLVPGILRGLAARVRENGFSSIMEAIGSDGAGAGVGASGFARKEKSA